MVAKGQTPDVSFSYQRLWPFRCDLKEQARGGCTSLLACIHNRPCAASQDQSLEEQVLEEGSGPTSEDHELRIHAHRTLAFQSLICPASVCHREPRLKCKHEKTKTDASRIRCSLSSRPRHYVEPFVKITPKMGRGAIGYWRMTNYVGII